MSHTHLNTILLYDLDEPEEQGQKMWEDTKASVSGLKLKFLPTLSRAEDRGTLRCPFCRDSIYPAITVIRCKKCRTIHHEKCWQENRRCSVFGCGGNPEQEHTEYYLIETFQKRRKKLLRSWLVSIITALAIGLTISYFLVPYLPMHGLILFCAAVAIFIIAIIVLNGYAQYLCPACGHQPRITTRNKKYLFQFDLHFDVIHNRLLLNPANCPTCKVALR
jgi:hypothetical protein